MEINLQTNKLASDFVLSKFISHSLSTERNIQRKEESIFREERFKLKSFDAGVGSKIIEITDQYQAFIKTKY